MTSRSRSTWIYATVLIISLASSSFTLWLLEESWVKIPLFIIQASLIIIFVLILDNGNSILRSVDSVFDYLNNKATAKWRFPKDILLIFFSGTLLVFFLFEKESVLNHLQLLLSFICVGFLSGMVILDLLRLGNYFSKLEYLVMAFILSFIFSGFITLALQHFHENIRGILIPVLFLSLGLLSMLSKSRKGVITSSKLDLPTPRPQSLSRRSDLLAIGLCFVFCITFYFIIYPGFTLLPDVDISRHFNYSLVLSRSPDLYIQFEYLLFHAFEATFYVLSGLNQSVITFQSIQVGLNVFVFLSVYIFAKRYLEKIDSRIPSLATIFFTIFSNFSFISFTELRLMDDSVTLMNTTLNTMENTLGGSIFFIQPIMWFVPLSVSFVMLSASFLLLRFFQIPSILFVTIYSVLLLAMYLTHIAEAITFILILVGYSLVHRNSRQHLRIDLALLSCLLSIAIAMAFSYYTGFVWESFIRHDTSNTFVLLSLQISFILTLISLVFRNAKSIVGKVRQNKYANELKPSQRSYGNKFYAWISIILLVMYFLILFSWYFDNNIQHYIFSLLNVSPWFIYPLFLGVPGLLAILAIRYLHNILPKASQISIILFAILFSILIGRIISFINLEFEFTGYWERRIVQFVFLFVCIVSPIPVIFLKEQLKRAGLKNMHSKTIFVTIISLIVLLGFSSTTIQLNFWSELSRSDQSKVNSYEVEALDYLRDVFKEDSHSFVISPSQNSRHSLALSSSPYILSSPEMLITSMHPELALFSLNFHNLNHAYIYVNNPRDSEILKDHTSSWFNQYLVEKLPIVFSNQQVTIYNASQTAFSQPNSDTVIVKPIEEFDDSWLLPFDVLSQSDYNYTSMYETDPDIFQAKKIILGYDPDDTYDRQYDFTLKEQLKEWRNISGMWERSPAGLYSTLMNNNSQNPRSDHLVLSPYLSKYLNTTLSTSFSFDKPDDAKHNLISFVYSWIDPKNYRLAGINIFDGEIYLNFVKVINGKGTFYPQLPGYNTNLNVNQGLNQQFNLTLSIVNNIQQIKLNNQSQLIFRDTPELGLMGLGYQNIQNAVFKNFDLYEFRTSYTQELIAKYLSFVESGGELFVIGPKTHGMLYDVVSNSSNFDPKYDDVPKIMEKNIGRGKITYLDGPLNSIGFKDRVNSSDANLTNSKILELINPTPIDKTSFTIKDIFKKMVASFKDILALGNASIYTSSFLFPDNYESLEMQITTNNNEQYHLKNISALDINGNNKLKMDIVNSGLLIADGKGFYSNFIMEKDPRMDPDIPNIAIRDSQNQTIPNIRVTADGRTFEIQKVSNISFLSDDPFHLYARQPQVDVSGNMTLNQLKANLQYSNIGYVPGGNLDLSGKISLSIYLSDRFSFANGFSVDKDSTPFGKIQSYNYFDGLIPSKFPFSFLLLLILPSIAIIFILMSRNYYKVGASNL